MRAVLVILALVCLAAAAALYLGFVNVQQTRPGAVQVQTPKFEADVGRVAVGTENKTVVVPKLEVERAGAAGNTQGR